MSQLKINNPYPGCTEVIFYGPNQNKKREPYRNGIEVSMHADEGNDRFSISYLENGVRCGQAGIIVDSNGFRVVGELREAKS